MSSAASFVDPINAEYREVVKAEKAALPHAIKCGEMMKKTLGCASSSANEQKEITAPIAEGGRSFPKPIYS